jgi:hypothetical protein
VIVALLGVNVDIDVIGYTGVAPAMTVKLRSAIDEIYESVYRPVSVTLNAVAYSTFATNVIGDSLKFVIIGAYVE